MKTVNDDKEINRMMEKRRPLAIVSSVLGCQQNFVFCALPFTEFWYSAWLFDVPAPYLILILKVLVPASSLEDTLVGSSNKCLDHVQDMSIRELSTFAGQSKVDNDFHITCWHGWNGEVRQELSTLFTSLGRKYRFSKSWRRVPVRMAIKGLRY